MSQNTTAMQRGEGGETTGATDMTTQQTDALPALIARFRGLHFDHAPDGWPAVRTREITALLDRITELESQLAQRFDAADMATASAQGFRDGVASLTAQAADSVQEDAAREAIEKVLALFPFNALIQKFTVNNGPCLTADNDDEFYSVKRVLAFLTEIKTTLDAACKQGGL